jgi:carbon storage regulator CsrA
MLVLSRKAQQSIRIGDSITVTIIKVKGNSIRIGIEAPDDMRIVRSELPDFSPQEEKGVQVGQGRTRPSSAAQPSHCTSARPETATAIRQHDPDRTESTTVRASSPFALRPR